MPVYLVHGFRWPREGFTGIRVHAVIHNLDDFSAEYIQNGNSRRALLRSFHNAYPEIMKELDQSAENEVYVQPGFTAGGGSAGAGAGAGVRRLEFIEQYNPEDMEGPYAVSQPFAYVGDKVVVIAAPPGGSAVNGTPQGQESSSTIQAHKKPTSCSTTALSALKGPDPTALSVNVEEVIANGPGLTNKAWEALADLRDKIAEGEKIGWWVVYNGDPERGFDQLSDEDEGYDEEMEDVEDEDGVGGEGAVERSVDSQRNKSNRPGGSDNAPIPTSSVASYSIPAQKQHRPQPQQQKSSPNLTALPVRPSPPVLPSPPPVPARSPTRSRSRPNTAPSDSKGKVKDVPEDPAKLKEVAKSQGLRKKFFGRRT